MNGVLLAILFLFLPASSVADDLFDINKPVADGVYAAIAKPAYKVNCNAAIIFLDDVVLVVDTHSSKKPPSCNSRSTNGQMIGPVTGDTSFTHEARTCGL
jgi:hypothetical protein